MFLEVWFFLLLFGIHRQESLPQDSHRGLISWLNPHARRVFHQRGLAYFRTHFFCFQASGNDFDDAALSFARGRRQCFDFAFTPFSIEISSLRLWIIITSSPGKCSNTHHHDDGHFCPSRSPQRDAAVRLLHALRLIQAAATAALLPPDRPAPHDFYSFPSRFFKHPVEK